MANNIDWKNLGFGYFNTGTYVSVSYKNKSWQSIEKRSDPYINIHCAASALHYGQACFEGLKAFRQKNGSVACFRPQENAQRMIDTANRSVMVAPPIDLFLEAMSLCIKENTEFIPPYGTGASLYIRPLLIGTDPRIGVSPSEEYLFLILVMPVGPYYAKGFKPIKAFIQEAYDRAAPKGVGNVKVAGNYAAGMKGDTEIKSKGYQVSLYLDSASHTYIDEFTTSNFFAITKDKKYVTPNSSSILPSITNKSLQTIARDLGMSVEKRQISYQELQGFAEVGACGTAAIITPIYSITRGETVYTYGTTDQPGETLRQLYDHIQAIQYGEIEDIHQWMYQIK